MDRDDGRRQIEFAERHHTLAEAVQSAILSARGTPLQWLLQRLQRDAAVSLA